MILVALTLAGCGAIGLTDRQGRAPGTEEEVVLAIEGVDPAWGLPTEETEVTITGPGVGTATSVSFGNADDVDFTVVDDATIVATAPAPGFETVVDVRVVGGAGADTLAGGFTYAGEEPADADTDTDSDSDTDSDTDADTDTDTSGAGKTGGLIELNLLQITCPACLGLTSDVSVTATAAFHEPTRDSWLDWVPAEGSCVNNPEISQPATTFLDAGAWVFLTSGSVSVGLQGDRDNVYSAGDLAETDFVRNAGYDLTMSGDGADLDFNLADAVTTPQGLSSVTPTAVLYTDDADLFTARISRSGTNFTWAPSGGTGSFLVELFVYRASDGAALGQVTCRGPDNGALTVPGSVLGSYPTGSLLLVGMYRYTLGGFERPDDSSTVDTVAKLGVLGTGSLAP